tara:strand:- start:1663 stop:1878 length:216 start_codon:yes stop_codon:yes gene_type:complete
MVKKIRIIDDTPEETVAEASERDQFELAKSMDWKLWEILLIMQKLEKKLTNLQITDPEDLVDGPTITKPKK